MLLCCAVAIATSAYVSINASSNGTASASGTAACQAGQKYGLDMYPFHPGKDWMSFPRRGIRLASSIESLSQTSGDQRLASVSHQLLVADQRNDPEGEVLADFHLDDACARYGFHYQTVSGKFEVGH